MDEALAQVKVLAARQGSCARTRDCVRLGLSKRRIARLVRQGHWRRMYRGVYVIHCAEPTWRERAQAALLYAGKGAVLSHSAAAFLHGLTRTEPRVVEVSIPAHRMVEPAPGIRVHRRREMPSSSGALPATRLAHTAVDLVSRMRTVDDVVGLITEACRRGATPWELREVVNSRTRLRHRKLVSEMIYEADAGIESPLERHYHYDVERAHGLPRARLQVRAVIGGAWTRADRVYEEYGLRVELDGQLAHPGGRTADDVWRDNAALVERAELTLRYRWIHVVSSSCQTAAQVSRALQRGGWTGRPRPCGPGCVLDAALELAA